MTSHKDAIRLVIAGGGTGGHVFPGVAVAEALEELARVDVMWIGTGRPVEELALKSRGWDHRVLNVRPLAGRGWVERSVALAILPFSVARAAAWLRSFRPHVVLGVGGYVAGPVMVAARLVGTRVALHEQNVTPGLTNRLAGRFAHVVFVGFPGTRRFFPGRRVVCTGNPVRREILDAAAHNRAKDHGAGRPHRVLVLGGSQGARAINTMVSSALVMLGNSGMNLQVVHQTGRAGCKQVEETYKKAGMDARVLPFISSVGEKMAWADLVVSRAGAGTVSELAAVGTAAVLIPYPHAAGGHQEYNAREFAGAGAGVYLREEDIGAVKLSAIIQEILEDPGRISGMARKARELGRPDAAGAMARELLGLCGITRMGEVPGTLHRAECGYSKGVGAENV